MKKLIFALLAVAIVAGLIQGCAREEVVKVGVMAPFTGDVASWGDMQRRSTELALEQVNAKGGIRGRQVKVIYEDTKADPSTGVNAFRKLADVDRVQIAVGFPASNVALAMAPLANEKKVVLLSSGSTAAAVGEAGPYIFRIMPSDDEQSAIMADWAWELGYRQVAIIYVENAWGRGLMEAFSQGFGDKGGDIVTVQSSDQDATDFRTQLSKIQALKPDAIYAPLYTSGAGLMIKQAREMGLKQQILGADVWGTPELIQAAGDAANGVLYTTFGEYQGPEYQEFAKKYKEKHGMDAETYATYCYDAFMIAVEAISRLPEGEEISAPNIRESLLSIENYRGVTGPTTFGGSNSATGKTFDKMTVKDGEHVPAE